MELKQAIAEIRKGKERKFKQKFDIIFNLRGVDVKRDNIAAVIDVPHAVKKKRVCGFFETKNDLVTSVTKADFSKYRDEKKLKELTGSFDFFIAEGKLMPLVASTFGKVLGPQGKMPSPQLGILMKVDDSSVKAVLSRIDGAVKIRVKEPSIKIAIGKEEMKDSEVIENIKALYEGLVKVLPVKHDNIKNIMLKTTMGKPIVVEVRQ
jgi:large subunit ribosomal protein L1